jgi:hypothetical protein
LKALVVNCSEGYYNLAAAKLADWVTEQGYQVVTSDGMKNVSCAYDLVCLSVVFTWHAPLAAKVANMVKANSEVWCGGPGITHLAEWWKEQTGLTCTIGLDHRFERQRGNYKYGFAARGCPGMGTEDRPKPCWFCDVWKIEGTKYTYDWQFQPTPILCDNNLSAQPDLYQWYTIEKYKRSGVRLLDANSGFEPATFTEDTYFNWKPILRGPWRFALDVMRELPDVKRMMGILKDEPKSKKRVYVLVGNEPIAACYERAMFILDNGGEPFCQAVMAHDTLTKEPLIWHDWTRKKLEDFCRYFNRFLWRYVPLSEYRYSPTKPPTFAGSGFNRMMG